MKITDVSNILASRYRTTKENQIRDRHTDRDERMDERKTRRGQVETKRGQTDMQAGGSADGRRNRRQMDKLAAGQRVGGGERMGSEWVGFGW